MGIQKPFTSPSGLDAASVALVNVGAPQSSSDAATKSFASNANNITTGTLAVLYGGTGATTASGAAANILPIQTNNAGKVLSTDGSGSLSWITVPAGTNIDFGTFENPTSFVLDMGTF